jgi:hypothetical protein
MSIDFVTEDIKDNDCAILYAPISANKDDIFKALSENVFLCEAMQVCKADLIKNGKEIFSENHNIIIAEDGYYVGVLVKDLVKVNPETWIEHD